MNVYEIRLKVYLLQSVSFKESFSQIGKLIDSCLVKDDHYLRFHNNNAFKNYSYASFYPLEENKIYKEGGIYTIQIRTIDEDLKNYFMKNLGNSYTQAVKGLSISCKPIRERLIQEIYSITPFVAKFDSGYWKNSENMDVLLNRLKVNVIKKYNQFNKVKIDEDFDFINYFRLTNKKPIGVSYKNIQMLGDKAVFSVDSNQRAQSLAYFSLGTGIGEMGSRGFGFVNFREC
jgi:CRISPR-associated endoribonuclease Cas6